MRNTPLRSIAVVSAVTAALFQGASAAPRSYADSPLSFNQVPAFQRGGFGQPFGGPPPFGGPDQQDIELLDEFDLNRNGRLDRDERRSALAKAESLGLNRGRGGRGRGASWGEPAKGPALSPNDVKRYPDSVAFYEPTALRTLFLTFEDADWERQLMAFKPTDVRVPATLTVDGKSYAGVGVQFHGNTSFSDVPVGYKHSMTIEIDYTDDAQRLAGYKELLLLNAHSDPSYLRSVLAMQIARDYIAAPKSNFVRVVINGESWGIYPSIEHFNKDFVAGRFPKGKEDDARWKVPGSPRGGGGLEYLGEDSARYRSGYDIKSDDEPDAWRALARMTRILNETPATEREAALRAVLDVDAAVDFIAVDNALVNNDGYWVRASDYNLYLDQTGRFHVIPYDTNETFPAGGGGRGGRGGGNAMLDPFVGLSDASKPLRAKLLEVPALRARYVRTMRDVASKWLAWERLGPVVAAYHDLIREDVRTDTRGVHTLGDFEASVEGLRRFAEARRTHLLDSLK